MLMLNLLALLQAMTPEAALNNNALLGAGIGIGLAIVGAGIGLGRIGGQAAEAAPAKADPAAEAETKGDA